MAIDFQPYVGPRPYQRNDLAPFFGRNREADELVSLVISSWEVLFYAQSGAGKTSLLNAGVIPLLEEEGFEILPLARVQGVIPEGIQSEEIQNLYVFNTLMSWAKDEANPKRFVQMSLTGYLKERKHRIDNEGQPLPRALIFDQFEEIFTLYQDRWNDRNDFFKQVRDALKAENRLLRVIFTIREDFIAQLDPYAHLLPEKLRTRFRIERLRVDAALAAVTGPLRKTERSFANGVAEKLVEDLLRMRVETITGETIEVIGEFVEPVQLQVVCQNLWQELPPDVIEITEQHLLALGGVDRPLSRFYESAVNEAAAEAGIKEKELRQWCEKWLITSNGTRNIVHRETQFTEELPTSALDSLVAHHLINLELRAGSYWYELTHDGFIEPIRTSNFRWKEEKVNQASLMIRQAEQSITMQDYDRALDTSMKAYTLSEEIGDPQGEANALFYLGKAFEGQKQDDEALTTYAKALELVKQIDARELEAYLLASQRKYVYTYYNQGLTYFSLKQFEQAIEDFNRALELDSKDVDAYNNRGLAYSELKQFEQAIEDFNRALELAPKDAYTYYNRGLAYSELKQFKQAIEDFNRALELDPQYVYAYSNRSIAYSNLVLEQDPNDVDAYFNRGFAYYGLAQYEQAIADYDRALELNPNYVKSYFCRGLANASLQQYERAIEDFSLVLELDPKHVYAYSNRGLAYSNLKQYECAIDDYDNAIELDSKDVNAYYNRGLAYNKLKEYERAIEDFDYALELDPRYAGAYYMRGLTYLWLRDINQAQIDLKLSWQMDLTNVNYGWMTEWAVMCQGKPDLETARQLEDILAVDPNTAEASISRGVAQWIHGSFEEAETELNRAISLNPELEDTYFWKGVVLAYNGQDDAAIAALEKSLELGIPPLLLSPLRWLEQDKPDFYRKYAAPLLARYEI